MTVALQAKIYPYIGSDREIADGKPIIVGTRITVRCIAGYYQMGMSAHEILTTLPHLTPHRSIQLWHTILTIKRRLTQIYLNLQIWNSGKHRLRRTIIRKPRTYENRVIFGRRCTFSVGPCLAQKRI